MIARDLLRRDVMISQRAFIPLYQSFSKRSTLVPIPEWIKTHLRQLTISLNPNDNHRYSNLYFERSLDPVHIDMSENIGSYRRLVELGTQTRALEIVRLKIMTDISWGHQDFTLAHEHPSTHHKPFYLGQWIEPTRHVLFMLQMASPPALTRLKLDLRGEGFFNYTSESEEWYRPHLCTAINSLFDGLPNLLTIAVRIGAVCPQLVKYREREKASLRVETFFISLSMCDEGRPPCGKCRPNAWECNTIDPGPQMHQEMAQHMCDALRHFKTSMAKPKMLRLLELKVEWEKDRIAEHDDGRLVEIVRDCINSEQWELPGEHGEGWVEAIARTPEERVKEL